MAGGGPSNQESYGAGYVILGMLLLFIVLPECTGEAASEPQQTDQVTVVD